MLHDLAHRALDASVVLSFDRTGYWRHARDFTDRAERDLTDRDVLITAGTSGIGLAAVRSWRDRGARVTTWARSIDRGVEPA